MRSIVPALLLAFGTCSRASAPPDEPTPEARPVAGGGESTGTPSGCGSVECWREQAAQAERLGALDVAAAHRGRVFALAPDASSLSAWVEPLIDQGALEAARAALTAGRAEAVRLGQSDWVAALDARIASLPKEPSDAAAVRELSDIFSRESAAIGEPLDAPVHAGPAELAQAGELQWRRGDAVGARRWWSRARTLLRERGGAVDVVAVETWYTNQVLWRDGRLALVRRYTPAFDYGVSQTGALDLVAAEPGMPLTRRLRFTHPAEVAAFSDDGRTLVRDEAGALVFQDMSSGAVMRRIAAQADAPMYALAVAGSGAAMRVLAAHGREIVLWDAAGAPLQRFALAGTTPTITRVYRAGRGTRHDNILRDSPTWPTSLALTADGSRIAVGGSDGKVRLFDRGGGKPRELAFAWKYVERRPMGANPDLNSALALRFSPDGAQLVAVHEHGDILIWDARTGALRKHVRPHCSAEEARRVVNRYAEPGEPPREATAEERESCGRATAAALSPDARLVVTGGGMNGVRLRDARTGAPIALHLEDGLPDQYFAVSPSGAVVMADLYGAVQLIAPASPPQPLALKPRTGPVRPWISSDGRVFAQFTVGEPVVAWDLVARRRLELVADDRQQVLALSPTASHVAVHTGEALEIRQVGSPQALARVPTRASPFASEVQFSRTSGHVLVGMKDDRGRTIERIELPAGTRHPLRLDDPTGLQLSPDGRWIASWRHDSPLKIVRAAGGEVVASLDDKVHRVAFASDGSFVAWLVQPDRTPESVRVRARWLDGPGPEDIHELALGAWGTWLAAAGEEVLVLRGDGALTRWRPHTGARDDLKSDALAGLLEVAVADDGKHLFLTGYGRVLVHDNDAALTGRLTVASLLSGGWLALGRTGAMDGSDDAPDHLLARVRGVGEEFVAPGRLAWDGLHVAGLVARALAGDDAAPPLRLAP
ncbi:WD40 repeat domain-containing protein [Nannocystis punicea]|uniref:WD40 repeat domain-containing protein n=1 Tax=Nannocystis punicea TaxID=2995304 RepID=A0ABY7H0D9_9BACT|nr:WD40 repeat domain-containing protein [Nannocystis poenicansa]WAS92575.1 WD40 repeat domain-containing protein [Nannocystis poenicansa]